jgi:hypothetical protein
VAKRTRKTPDLILAKGQIWRANGKHIQIVELGETIHYRMQHKSGPMRKTQTTLPETMQDYLKTKGAELVEALPVVEGRP